MKNNIKKADENFTNRLEKKCIEVKEGITTVIESELPARGWSKQNLADATGIAQPTISVLMQKGKDRSWTLNHLVRVAMALDVSLTELIAAAETGEPLPRPMADLAGTEPHSAERLTRIVQGLASPGTSKEVLDLYFTAAMLQISVPKFAADYYAGTVSDREVYDLLTRVNSALGPQENLWGKLSAFMVESKEA